MFFLAIAMYNISNRQESITLDPGYYKFEAIGAPGGTGCKGQYGNPADGGYPAKISAKFHIKTKSTIKVVAGSKPKTFCSNDRDSPQISGDWGDGGYSASSLVGAGGGFSSLSIENYHVAIAGGGGGGGLHVPGTPAGGYDTSRLMSYKYYHDSSNCYLRKKYFSQTSEYHDGKSAKKPRDSSQVGGAGGGGGYLGGEAGTPYSIYDQRSRCKQPGVGGSSWVDTKTLYDISIEDGYTFRHDTHGEVHIYPLTVCSSGCADCEQSNGNKCTECLPRFLPFENACYSSCSETPAATYFDTISNKCIKCMEHCQKCTSKYSCNQCENGYHIEGISCVKNIQIPSPATSSTSTEHIISQPVQPTDPKSTTSRSTELGDVPSQPIHLTNPGHHVDHTDIKGTSSENIHDKQENTTSVVSDISIQISSVNVDKSSNSPGIANIKGAKALAKKQFMWWIIVAIVCGIVIIALIIGIVACRAIKRDENSFEMEDEEAIEVNNQTNQVTMDNPLFASADKEEDPFKGDFNSETPASTVFEQKELKDIEEIEDIEIPNYDFLDQ